MRIRWPKVVPDGCIASPDVAWLVKNGWKCKRTRSGSTTNEIFISPCGGFVCKRAFLTNEMPACAIPTKFLEKKKGRFAYILQPMADLSYKKTAEEMISTILGDDACEYDLHKGNVGFYNGAPVMIDW